MHTLDDQGKPGTATPAPAPTPPLARCGHTAYHGDLDVCTEDECPCAASRIAAPTPPSEPDVNARIYPCDDCGLMRSKAEGGTTFTCCDECWEKHYGKPRGDRGGEG